MPLPRWEWLVDRPPQRIAACTIATLSAVLMVGITAAGADLPRMGLWAGLAGVLAVAVGLVGKHRFAVLGGLFGLILQYLIAMVGREGLDPWAAVNTGLLTMVIESAHWAMEAGRGTATALGVVRARLLRVAMSGLLGWLLGLGVLAVSLGTADVVIARAVAVALSVAVWAIVLDVLRSPRRY